MSSVNPYVVESYNSFIYLVARGGLQAPASNQRIPSSQYYPVVLMVKENNGLWGVPGGQSEISDADAYSTARREFGDNYLINRGGFGLTPVCASGIAAFYSATARPVRWFSGLSDPTFCIKDVQTRPQWLLKTHFWCKFIILLNNGNGLQRHRE